MCRPANRSSATSAASSNSVRPSGLPSSAFAATAPATADAALPPCPPASGRPFLDAMRHANVGRAGALEHRERGDARRMSRWIARKIRMTWRRRCARRCRRRSARTTASPGPVTAQPSMSRPGPMLPMPPGAKRGLASALHPIGSFMLDSGLRRSRRQVPSARYVLFVLKRPSERASRRRPGLPRSDPSSAMRAPRSARSRWFSFCSSAPPAARTRPRRWSTTSGRDWGCSSCWSCRWSGRFPKCSSSASSRACSRRRAATTAGSIARSALLGVSERLADLDVLARRHGDLPGAVQPVPALLRSRV